jgi:MFS family permease
MFDLGLEGDEQDRRYLRYLIFVALAGWALAAYDFNLLVFALPTVSQQLHLSVTQTGLLVFIVYAALFVITLFVGYGMDVKGRRWMWMPRDRGAATRVRRPTPRVRRPRRAFVLRLVAERR